jgi:hypothetical protein
MALSHSPVFKYGIALSNNTIQALSWLVGVKLFKLYCVAIVFHVFAKIWYLPAAVEKLLGSSLGPFLHLIRILG